MQTVHQFGAKADHPGVCETAKAAARGSRWPGDAVVALLARVLGHAAMIRSNLLSRSGRRHDW